MTTLSTRISPATSQLFSLGHARFPGLFIALLAAAILTGCARTREVAEPRPELPAGFPNQTIDQIRENIVLTSETLTSFTGKASFSVNTPQRSGRFSAGIRARQSDSLYLTISPGFGIEAARALITPDSFFLYDRIHNELTYGSVGAAEDLLGVPVGNDDLFHNLLGIIFPEPGIDWTVTAGDSLYFVTDPTGLRRFTIDPTFWRVLRYEERTPSDELIEERSFSEFDRFEGIYVPRQITFRRPQENSTASLYYRELDLSPESLSFQLRVSDSATRVPISGP